jgi:hypothetical protein
MMIYKAKCASMQTDRLEVDNIGENVCVAVWQDRQYSSVHLPLAESLRLAEALLKNYRKVATP